MSRARIALPLCPSPSPISPQNMSLTMYHSTPRPRDGDEKGLKVNTARVCPRSHAPIFPMG